MRSITSCVISLTAASLSSAVKVEMTSDADPNDYNSLVTNAVEAAKAYNDADSAYYSAFKTHLEEAMRRAPEQPAEVPSAAILELGKNKQAAYTAFEKALGPLHVTRDSAPDEVKQALGRYPSEAYYRCDELQVQVFSKYFESGKYSEAMQFANSQPYFYMKYVMDEIMKHGDRLWSPGKPTRKQIVRREIKGHLARLSQALVLIN
jgi:nucleoid-associated protein YgaU